MLLFFKAVVASQNVKFPQRNSALASRNKPTTDMHKQLCKLPKFHRTHVLREYTYGILWCSAVLHVNPRSSAEGFCETIVLPIVEGFLESSSGTLNQERRETRKKCRTRKKTLRAEKSKEGKNRPAKKGRDRKSVV